MNYFKLKRSHEEERLALPNRWKSRQGLSTSSKGCIPELEDATSVLHYVCDKQAWGSDDIFKVESPADLKISTGSYYIF